MSSFSFITLLNATTILPLWAIILISSLSPVLLFYIIGLIVNIRGKKTYRSHQPKKKKGREYTKSDFSEYETGAKLVYEWVKEIDLHEFIFCNFVMNGGNPFGQETCRFDNILVTKWGVFVIMSYITNGFTVGSSKDASWKSFKNPQNLKVFDSYGQMTPEGEINLKSIISDENFISHNPNPLPLLRAEELAVKEIVSEFCTKKKIPCNVFSVVVFDQNSYYIPDSDKVMTEKIFKEFLLNPYKFFPEKLRTFNSSDINVMVRDPEKIPKLSFMQQRAIYDDLGNHETSDLTANHVWGLNYYN